MTLLAIEDLEVVYDDLVLALRGVSLTVDDGAIVALLGANGAGKTTTLKAASGLLPAERGRITRGAVRVSGRPVDELAPGELVGHGVVQVLEGRHCFPHLTIEENLLSGALARRASRAETRTDLERVYAHFPRLATKRRAAAGYCSGGEQQMIAIGRALMARPRLILLDEPSMGLAPQVVEEIFTIVAELHRSGGVSFVLAEQNARLALRYADHGYVLENGRVVAHGTAAELGARPDVKEFYLGAGDERAARSRRAGAPRPEPS